VIVLGGLGATAGGSAGGLGERRKTLKIGFSLSQKLLREKRLQNSPDIMNFLRTLQLHKKKTTSTIVTKRKGKRQR